VSGNEAEPMGYRVIVVEDEGIIAMMLSRMIERLGCTVLACLDNSETADQAIAEYKPDLVFMDIQINGERDGIALAAVLAERQPETRIVFLTANSDDATRNAALGVKPLAFLRKPVEIEDLANVLHAMDAGSGARSGDE